MVSLEMLSKKNGTGRLTYLKVLGPGGPIRSERHCALWLSSGLGQKHPDLGVRSTHLGVQGFGFKGFSEFE